MKSINMTEERMENNPGTNNLNINFNTNGLEKEIDAYKQSKLNNIKFSMVIRHMLVSVVALIISFFLDISYVPLLGNITIDIAHKLFPQWTPVNQSIQPISFWWMPVLVYGIFILFAFKAYIELRNEIKQSTSSNIIDRIIGSSISVIDGIATALPLIGAAILLISIKLGPEVFLGLSVPFEMKALIVLALGKLFEPVLDELGVEFQHVINRATEMRNKFIAQKQLDFFYSISSKFNGNGHSVSSASIPEYFSLEDAKAFESVIAHTVELSKQVNINFGAAAQLLEKISAIPGLDTTKLQEIKNLADSITQASNALKDNKAVEALHSLESIVNRK